MKIVVENIGSINRADIELGNLTVISGENDSGKTTISKIVYAIGQAASSFSIDFRKYQNSELRDLYEELYFTVSRHIKIDNDIKQRFIFEQDGIIRDESLIGFFSNLRKSANYGDFSSFDYDYVADKVNIILSQYRLPEAANLRLVSILNRLKYFYSEYVTEPTDKFIFRALKSEFFNEIVKKNSSRDDAFLSLSDGESTIFELTFNDRDTLKFVGDRNIRIQDSTLVEGPTIFQLTAIIRGSTVRDTLNHRKNGSTPLPYHIIDLCSKLDGTNRNLHFIKDDFCRNSDWDISEFYDGSLEYQSQSRSFILNKNGYEYYSTNVSSGMKAVAILDLLVKGDYINKNTILILDEPETNLHPKWQKKYAHAIVKLAARDTKILINTHSPYMLEALKFYSDSSKQELGSKFYFSFKDKDDSTKIEDTQGNIIPIIEVLSAPLNDLMEEMQKNVDDF